MRPDDFARKINEWARGTAEGTVLRRGRTSIVLEVRVYDDARRLVAPLTATQLMPRPA